MNDLMVLLIAVFFSIVFVGGIFFYALTSRDDRRETGRNAERLWLEHEKKKKASEDFRKTFLGEK